MTQIPYQWNLFSVQYYEWTFSRSFSLQRKHCTPRLAELAAAARTQLASLARAATQADLVPGIARWERSMAELVRGAGARQQAAASYQLPHDLIIFLYIF